MKIFWIVTAMQEETKLIIKKYSLVQDKKLKNITTYIWDYNNDKIVLVLSWLWKIQATIWTCFLLDNYKIDNIINIWLAWNISIKNIQIWDIVLIKECFQHDFSISFPWEHDLYAKESIKVDDVITDIDIKCDFHIINWCVNLTWDQFIENPEIIKWLKDRFSPDTVDMEAYAILSVAREYDMLDRCLVIKAISDSANHEATENLFKNIELAMNNSIKVLDYFLTN